MNEDRLKSFDFARLRTIEALEQENRLLYGLQAWRALLLGLAAAGILLGWWLGFTAGAGWVVQHTQDWMAVAPFYLSGPIIIFAFTAMILVGMVAAIPGWVLLLWVEEGLPARIAANRERIGELTEAHRELVHV